MTHAQTLHMPGPLLRQVSVHNYRALGAQGRTVISVAPQVRAGVRRQQGQVDGEILAIPQVNEAGSTIDWYAPFPGVVVPWSAASDDERYKAAAALQQVRLKFLDRSSVLLAQNPRGDAEVFARMLPFATQIPDEQHIYIVDGRPVLTCWGFQPVNAGPDLNIVRDLPIRAPAAAVPPVLVDAPGATMAPAQQPWWRWLLWLLGPLLAFLLLFLLLRGCGFPVGGLGVPTTAPGVSGPDVRLPGATVTPAERPHLAPGSGGAGVLLPSGNAPVISGTEAAGGGGTFPQPGGPAAVAPAGSPEVSPNEAPLPPSLPLPDPAAANMPVPQPAMPDDTGALAIPDSALQDGSLEFLNGRWRSRTSLMDSRTGRPLDVEYEFKGGKGTATIMRSDGTRCTGPMEASIAGGRLLLDQTGVANCGDGQVFDRSSVECTPDSDGKARCKGLHGSGAQFHVEIVK